MHPNRRVAPVPDGSSKTGEIIERDIKMTKKIGLWLLVIVIIGSALATPVTAWAAGQKGNSPALPGEDRGLRNLSLSGIASATFYQTKSDVCPPSNVNDGDVTTRWSTYGAGSLTPHAIMIDLTRECSVEILNLLFMDVRRTFTFDVYVTNDPAIADTRIRSGLTPVLSGQKGQGSSPDQPSYTTLYFDDPVTGRYVTLNMTSSSSSSAGDNPVVAMYEFAVMGLPLSTDGDEIMDFKPSADVFVPVGTDLSALSLPGYAVAELADGRYESVPVEWDRTVGSSGEGTYLLTGTPVIPNGAEIRNSRAVTAKLNLIVGDESRSGRQTYSLNDDWRFYKGKLSGGEKVGLSETDFSYVTIPHTWNAEDGSDGGNNYYRGEGWYRRTLRWYHAADSKKIYLYFEGVSRVCEVFVNGRSVALHKGAYTAFYADITDALVIGENLIAVRADNTITADVATQTGDFTQYGGMYRGVTLVTTDKIHIDTSFGSSNLSILPTEVSADSATIEVSAKVRNDSDVPADAEAVFTFRIPKDGSIEWIENIPASQLPFDPASMTTPDGETVFEKKEIITLQPGKTQEIRFTFLVSNPRLWNGLSDPFRYEGELKILSGSVLKDCVTEYVGIRTFVADPSKGGLLNGKSYNLRGVSRHQDRDGMGSALTEKEHNEDFALIYEMGANAVRLAHYPQSDYFYSLCDQYGLLVWAENAFVNSVGGDGSYESPDATRAAFMDNVRMQLTELIRQQINHPSIVVWGIQNEVDPSYAVFMKAFCTELTELCHREDPTRLVTQATANGSNSGWPSDLICSNLYPGWYYSDYTQLKSYIDKFRAHAGGRPVGISEYGIGANYLHHCEGIPAVVCKADIPYQYEEYQSEAHESYLSQIADMDYLWCTFVWNMFDFGSDGRNEAQVGGINNKGLVSFDRTIKKDAFYLYKAAWSREPTVHICSSGFTLRERSNIAVKIYSNCDSVTLYVNGTQARTITAKEAKQGIVFIWDQIGLKGGRNEVRAVGKLGGETFTDETVWYYLVPTSDYYKIDSANHHITIPSGGAWVQNITRDIGTLANTEMTVYDSDMKAEIRNGPVREGMVLQIRSDEQIARYVFVRTNIAKGASVIASFEQSGHEALMAVDGSLSSYWSTYGTTSLPQSITLDLGKVYPMAEMKIMFFGSGRKATYDVFVSEDSPDPDKILVTGAEGHGYGNSGGLPDDAQYDYLSFPEGTVGRYIKIVVKDSEPAVTLAAIWEIEIFTSLQGSVNAPEDLLPEEETGNRPPDERPVPSDTETGTSEQSESQIPKIGKGGCGSAGWGSLMVVLIVCGGIAFFRKRD